MQSANRFPNANTGRRQNDTWRVVISRESHKMFTHRARIARDQDSTRFCREAEHS